MIGIIALLVGLLLPALQRGREAANKTKCLSNLRMIGTAMLMYCNDNKDYFTASANCYSQFAEDFIYWQQPSSGRDPTLYNAGNPRSLDNGALVKYMGNHFNPQNWICPSDDVSTHQTLGSLPQYPTGATVPAGTSYPYSYTMNHVLSDRLPLTDSNALAWTGGALKMSSVKHSSETIMMLEESSTTINDGHSSVVIFQTRAAGSPNNITEVTPGLDLLAVRHDSKAHFPDNVMGGTDTEGIPNTLARGNVVFCDGHAEFQTREFVHDPPLRHWDPTH